MPFRRRRHLVAVLALVLAACSGGAAGERGSSRAPAGTTTTTVLLPPIAPLTGLPLTDQARLARPALVVKVENAPASRPQSGLDKADVVFEEIVEGGVTRFLTVYHSTDAELVGPVRSVRPPSNLYTSTPKLYARAPAGAARPPGRFAEFLPADQPFAGAGATMAVNLTTMVGRTSVVFNYDAASRTWRRTGLVEGGGAWRRPTSSPIHPVRRH